MKKLGLLLFIFLLNNKAQSSELLISPHVGYGQSNFYGQTDVPTYRGSHYGASLEYKNQWDTFGLGIYTQYTTGKFDNTGNTNTQKEVLSSENITFGFKFYSDNIYLKIGYGVGKVKDESTGAVTKTLDLSENVYQAGAGMFWQWGSFTKFFIEGEFNFSEFEPEFGGLTRRTKLANYMGIIGFSFTLPSDIIKNLEN